MLTLVNYGLGNIQAFNHIYNRLGLPVAIASSAAELKAATRLILPGVGSFDWAMQRLNESGMRSTLDDLVLGCGVPVLGICVGMQMMATSSEEGSLPGLGWMNAQVRRFSTDAPQGKILLPHMGWNDVQPTLESPLFAAIETPRFYFLHSYYFLPGHPLQTLATTHYSVDFTSVACEKKIYGVQFHPEKSHGWGVQLLKNFAEI